ncbi:LPS-assembly protein LptD [Balneatrix alpica]|uniref:LPS-assembly protein LptD n=1 Tax=Balneatrix alpica TaxID=75684 RepID=A0ABV5ZD94_9GAMM|nr:LPS-assembly protein LptD [Balneatrix alpica]
MAAPRFVKTPLMLAISTALIVMQQSQSVAAAQGNDWQCSQLANGQWNCSPNPEAGSAVQSYAIDAAPAVTTDAVAPEMSAASQEQAPPAPSSTQAPPSAPEPTPAAVQPSAQASDATAEAATSTLAAETSSRILPEAVAEPAATTNTATATNSAEASATTTNRATDSVASPTLAQPRQYAGVQGWPLESPPANAIAGQHSYLDWYANPQGVDPLSHCSGQYIEPAFSADDLQLPSDQQQTYLLAERSETRLNENTQLYGPVQMRRGAQRISADYAEYDQAQELVSLKGNIRYREPGLLVVGQSGQLDMANGRNQLNNVEYVQQARQLRGEAVAIQTYPGAVTQLRQASFTRCEPGNNSWSILGTEINLYHAEGFGEARNATLRLGNVPVFYLPWFSFPISDERKSGFLYPSVRHTKNSGLEIALPYYLNLAPNYDATLTPRIIEKRGLLVESEFRYLNHYSYNVFNAALLPYDDKTGDARWLAGITHQGTPWQGWHSTINATKVSDKDYLRDLSTKLKVDTDSHLDQEVSLRYYQPLWNAGIRFKRYQTLDATTTGPYQEMPRLDVQGTIPEDNRALAANYRGQYTYFTRHPQNLTATTKVEGQRSLAELNSRYEWIRPWAHVIPRVRLNQRFYQLENTQAGQDTSPSIFLPTFSLDTGLAAEREYQLGNQRLRQTLEPRLFYVYTPYRDQDQLPLFDTDQFSFNYDQLWRDRRFSGEDRLADMNQVSYGLTTRFFDDEGVQRLLLGAGQAYYFSDRKVRLNASDPDLTTQVSPIAGRAEVGLHENVRLYGDLVYSGKYDLLTDRSLTLRYQSDQDHIASFRVRRYFKDHPEADGLDRNNEEYQTDLSFIWPLSAQYSLLARWNHDLKEKRSLETLIGLEYENCCWRIRGMHRHWYDGDAPVAERNRNGVFLQFILKGLAGFDTVQGDGANTKSVLEGITGFNERELNSR